MKRNSNLVEVVLPDGTHAQVGASFAASHNLVLVTSDEPKEKPASRRSPNTNTAGSNTSASHTEE